MSGQRIEDAIQVLRRHMPGARNRAIERAFLHGYHAGRHDAAGDHCMPDEHCGLWTVIHRWR